MCRVIVFVLALVIARPALAESLRPPVDDAVWRTIEGAGGDASARRIGVAPVVAGSLVTSLWGGVALLNTFLLLTESSLSGVPLNDAATGILMGAILTVPGNVLVFGLERLLTGVDSAWWLGPLALIVVDALLFGAIGINRGAPVTASPPTPAPVAIATAIAASVLYVAAHVGAQALAFGPVVWSDQNDVPVPPTAASP